MKRQLNSYFLAVRIALFFGALTVSAPLRAHHGSSVSYDVSKRITLRGTVTTLAWSNPHAQIYFDAKDEKGQIVNWIGEMNSPGVLAKAGWTKYSVKTGDQIIITLVRSKLAGTHSGLVGKVVLANGQVLEGSRELRGAARASD